MNENIVEKIKKLLALSKSPNEHEASLALHKAKELMDKYDISLLECNEQSDEYKEEMIRNGDRRPIEERHVLFILMEHFHVEALTGQNVFGHHVFLIGKPHHLEIAKQVLIFLNRVFRSLWKQASKILTSKRMKRKRRLKIQDTYYLGVGYGLHTKLTAQREQTPAEYAIILNDRSGLQNYFNTKYRNTKTTEDKPFQINPTAFLAGCNDGKNIEIHKPLQAANKPVKQLQ